MDNASKALIMAGAILLAVAIVGIGIYIFSSANGIVNDSISSMDSLSSVVFNQKFDVYMNKRITGTTAKNFIDVVINNNATSSTKVTVNLHAISTIYRHTAGVTPQQIRGLLNDSSYYRITPTKSCGTSKEGYRPDGTLSCMTIYLEN